jgi:hypothetical protein
MFSYWVAIRLKNYELQLIILSAAVYCSGKKKHSPSGEKH